MSEENHQFQYGEDSEPEIWNEYRWEEFFRESDKRTEKYSRLLDKYMDHPDCDRIIAEEMGWTHLLDEDDDVNEAWMDEMYFDEFEKGEEWKRLTGYKLTELDSVENLPIYRKAFEFTVDAINMVNTHLADYDDASVRSFCRHVTIPSAKIAGGFGLGFEMENLGGNIANCKRGLNAANKMLNALYDIGDKEFLERDLYLDFHGRAKEVRDELAVYIVELRERFNRGVS
jgi:hypothetical protein